VCIPGRPLLLYPFPDTRPPTLHLEDHGEHGNLMDGTVVRAESNYCAITVSVFRCLEISSGIHLVTSSGTSRRDIIFCSGAATNFLCLGYSVATVLNPGGKF